MIASMVLRKMRVIWHRLLMVLIAILIMAGCASSGSRVGFEEPKSMVPMVDFWVKVYSVWETNEVAFHDDRYLDVVYDVALIPRGDRLAWETTSRLIKDDLLMVEASLIDKRPLTATQKRMKNMLMKAGGTVAIRGAAERLRGQRGLKSEFLAGLERSQIYIPYFKAVMRDAGLPEAIAYLPHVESAFHQGARSKVGAAGMWQFMPSTARDFMPMRANIIDSRYDPYHSVQGAAKLMRANYRELHYWPLVITAYNSGAGHGKRAQARYGNDIGKIVYEYNEGAFKFASRNFYAEFLAAKRIAENPSHYFPGFRYRVYPSRIEGIELVVPMKLADLSRAVNVPSSVLIDLNPAWLRNIVNNQAEIPANYDIWLPKGTTKRIQNRGFYRLSKIQP